MENGKLRKECGLTLPLSGEKNKGTYQFIKFFEDEWVIITNTENNIFKEEKECLIFYVDNKLTESNAMIVKVLNKVAEIMIPVYTNKLPDLVKDEKSYKNNFLLALKDFSDLPNHDFDYL